MKRALTTGGPSCSPPTPHGTRLHLPLADAAPRIRDGDLLQFRPRRWNLPERLTALAGRGDHCHSALACWWDGELMVLESRLAGIRAVTLASQVERFPGLIDVYRTNYQTLFPEFHVRRMVQAMRRKTGRSYALRLLVRTTLSHTLLARLFFRAGTADNGHDTDHRGPEFCSQAIASAARLGGGVDPVPHLQDRATEPNDLTRSQLFNRGGRAYLFTLEP